MPASSSTRPSSTRTGDAIGGLLNATFGNAPELIIALVALRAGFFDMVRASIIGSILANLMLATGVTVALRAGTTGRRHDATTLGVKINGATSGWNPVEFEASCRRAVVSS